MQFLDRDTLGDGAVKQRSSAAVGIAVLVVIAIFLPDGGDMEEVLLSGGQDSPLRITQVSAPLPWKPLWQNPSLRGCCGDPEEFLWVFPGEVVPGKASEAAVGMPFRTRLVALDGLGRRARPSSAASVKAELSLRGDGAQVVPAAWRGAEMVLEMGDSKSEAVEAEMRIETPEYDTLLHSARINFSPGPLHSYSIEFLGGATEWVTNSWMEVAVAARDSFGNPTPLGPNGLSARVALRSQSSRVTVTHSEGVGFMSLDKHGQARMRVRSPDAGSFTFFVECLGHSAQQQFDLRESSSRTVTFKNPLSMQDWHAGRNISNGPNATQWNGLAAQVRKAFLHAWQGYRKYAWGRDELLPVSKKGKDNWGGMGMSILDSLTTLWLLDLPEEFEVATEFVERVLTFGQVDEEISVFELTIRALGGLLGAHSLSGRPIFLERARELGEKLLPVFNTSSGMPLPRWNLKRGSMNSGVEHASIAEAGSIQLEWRHLSQNTQDPRFQEAADKAFDAIHDAHPDAGLLPSRLSPPQVGITVADWEGSPMTVGGEADSYYEYLLKQYLQKPSDERFKAHWLRFMKDFPMLLRPQLTSVSEDVKYKVIGIKPDKSHDWRLEHLSCFAPGMIALGLMSLPEEEVAAHREEWTAMAKGTMAACAEMWTGTKTGIAPECIKVNPSAPHNFSRIDGDCAHSLVRPETAESLYYMYRLTGDAKYREWGAQMFSSLVEHSMTDAGFAGIMDVRENPVTKKDEMQTFVLAETFKYLYLLFASPDILDLGTYVLNTEGHPLRRFEAQ